MEFLIREAFLYVEIIGPQVAERHYELLNADEQIILPHVWEAVIEPGQTISMQMWPMVEDKEEEPAVDALEVIAPRREGMPQLAAPYALRNREMMTDSRRIHADSR